MKKISLLFCIISIFILSSCYENNNINDEISRELLNKKQEISKKDEKIKELEKKLMERKEIEEDIKKSLKKDNNKEEKNIKEEIEVYIPTKKEIELAWCKETKKAWEVEWCMKNSELIKNVEWYETRFSKSIQDDSWFKWVYEAENEDKLYTSRYIEKACWTFKDEWIIIDETVKASCPCPSGYHIPTPKEWKDTYAFYKNNINLLKSELSFDKNTWNRHSNWDYIPSWGMSFINHYLTSYYAKYYWEWEELNHLQVAWLFTEKWKLIIQKNEIFSGDAYSLRCIKNN